MPNTPTEQFLIESLSEHLGEPVTLNSSFSDDLGMDSLDKIEFGMKVESNYDLPIDTNIIAGWNNLNDVSDYLRIQNVQ